MPLWGPIVAALLALTPAVRVETAIPVGTTAPPIEWRCPDWIPLAAEVGWPDDQLATVDYVMHRESRCREDAVGSIPVRGKRALGLMQLLGWSCPPAGCLDARSNLTKALDLWNQMGWRPWCLRGDPVTGGC